jgi:23S rRNA (adenine2503-C2)-methyltransferase
MTQVVKQDIRKLSLEQMKEAFVASGEKAFRAKQVYEWLWRKSAASFEEMTNLSKPFRAYLEANYAINAVSIAEEQISEDLTIKTAFELADSHVVEGVLIPTPKRMTACISSQVGCSLSCAFCATGKLDRLRNLDGAEIYDQVVSIANQATEKYGKPLTNIVYMGMGEPLMNYKGLLESVEKITSPEGLGMSPKRITVSTAGIARFIKKLGDDEVKFNLALSLHAATDEKRNQIMPINKSNSLDALAEALQYFLSKTRGTITYEYIIFKDFNDSIEDAKDLIKFCRRVPAKVNIIEYNPIDGGEFERSPIERVDAFAAALERAGIQVNIRRSRGKDIDAACGQLANKNKVANPV